MAEPLDVYLTVEVEAQEEAEPRHPSRPRQWAVALGLRFYSFDDAMLFLGRGVGV